MKKQALALIFIISITLFAQYEWSTPRQLSRDGVGPYEFIGYPSIAMDNNGVLHAFWVISPSEDGSVSARYSQIEYRRSTNGGSTWSTTENLTPEYSTERINNMKAVCDSENNVHLAYLRGYESPYDVCYKKFDGVSWTATEIIATNATTYTRMLCDSNDRLYVTWVVGDQPYFTYLENDVWKTPESVGPGPYGISELAKDFNDNIYGIGATHGTARPCFFKYYKDQEDWTIIEELTYDLEKKIIGCAIATNKDSLYINNCEGISGDINTDNHLSKAIDDSIWSSLTVFGENNWWDREMFIDKYNRLHLFETHYYDGNSNGDTGLIHSVKKYGVWSAESIDSLHNFAYSEPNVAFDKANDKFYLIYGKSDRINQINRIYFQTKTIDTKIEDSDELLVMSYELEQNYPNPFNNQTNIEYILKNNSEIEINIYNTKGQFVQCLVNEKQGKGKYSILFNASELNSGVYYYQLKVDGIVKETKKMLYLR